MDDDLRAEAIKRLRKRAEFRTHVFTYLIVNAMLVGIWGTTSRGYSGRCGR